MTAGTLLLVAALAGAVVAAGAWAAVPRRGAAAARAGTAALGAACAAVVAAVALLQVALARQDTAWPYVERVAGVEMSAYYRVTAMWSALEGSLLLWLLALVAVAVLALGTTRALDPTARAATMGSLAGVVAVFAVVSLVASPFDPASGNAGRPSPLLRDHVAMGVHPPLLYAGFAALAVPYALSVGALACPRGAARTTVRWAAVVRAWNLAAWGALTAGIALGAWWSYAVLGWGGYWAWDPVENASLLPWLASTALLHTVGPRTRAGAWRRWAVTLAGLGFVLVVLAQLVTRSGLVESVHAFTTSPLGPVLAGVLGIVLLPWLALLVRAGRPALLPRDEPREVRSAGGRTLALETQRVLLVVVLVVVAVGTLLPTALLVLTGDRVSVGPPWYHRTLAPFALGLLVLLAAAPWLARSQPAPAAPWVPAALGAGVCCATGLGTRDAWLAVVAGLGAFTVAAGVPLRRAGTRARLGDRHASGAWLAHTGVALGAVAVLAGSHGSVTEDVLPAGGTLAAGDTTVTLVGLERSTAAGHQVVEAELVLGRGGEHAGTVRPQLRWYPDDAAMLAGPAVTTGVVDDVYVTLLDADPAGGTATVRLAVTPLVGWLWTAAALVVAGGTVALVPWRRPRRPAPPGRATREVGTPAPARVVAVALPAAALLTALLAGCAPPQPAELAPPLAGEDLDGAAVDIADLRGSVVLVTAWASWCGPCREEMPVLAEAQEELGDDGLQVLGVNVRDLPDAARAFADEHGATFPSVVDERGTKVVAWGLRGVPVSYLVDREGRVVERHPGPVDRRWIEDVVAPEVLR